MVGAHQFEHGRVHSSHRQRADVRNACDPRLHAVDVRNRVIDFAERPRHNRQIGCRGDSGVWSEAKGQIIVPAGLEQSKRALQMLARFRVFSGETVSGPEDPMRAWYYVELDLEVWAKHMYGQEFFDYLSANYEPVDFLFRVAEKSSVVLMDGGGFGGRKWSIRVSLANLDDEDYAQIGNTMRKSAEEYVTAWKAGKK
jgi:hypothetical protein